MHRYVRKARNGLLFFFILPCLLFAAAIVPARLFTLLVWRAILPSSFVQLARIVIRRGPFSLCEKTGCWLLLRKARKCQALSVGEWELLISFTHRGLLHEKQSKRPYHVPGLTGPGLPLWHEEFVAFG